MVPCVSFQFIFDLVLFSCLPYDYYKITTVVDKYRCLLSCQEDGACAAVAFKLDTSTCYFFNEKLPSSNNILEGVFLAYNARRVSLNKPQIDCPPVNGYNFNSAIGVCYKYYSDTVTNIQANDRCRQDGARGLVRVDTAEKQDFLRSIVPVSNMWAHVAGRLVSGMWIYDKQNPYDCQINMPYLSWASGQGMAGNGQPCVVLGSDALHDGFLHEHAPCYLRNVRLFIKPKSPAFI